MVNVKYIYVVVCATRVQALRICIRKMLPESCLLPTQLSIAEPSAAFAGIHTPQFISNKITICSPSKMCAATMYLLVLHGSLGLNLLQVLQYTHSYLINTHDSKMTVK